MDSLHQFQSTPPHGRRREDFERRCRCKIVSIHASAREATTVEQYRREYVLEFQSTPPHGRRQPGQECLSTLGPGFNPRLRTGGDSAILRLPGGIPRFQSTPPHGRRRELTEEQAASVAVSIHASAREATASSADGGACPHGFQSTPPHGRRHGTRPMWNHGR